MNDWRELLCRVFDGETLSAEESQGLNEALQDAKNQREATDWLRFESVAVARWRSGATPEAARDRLLAKAVLLEKHAELTNRRPSGSPANRTPALLVRTASARRWSYAAVAAATALVACCLWWIAGPRAEAYDSLRVQGDFHVLGPPTADQEWTLSRGERLVSGGQGARLALGGYCRVDLAPHSDVSLHGSPRREALELHQGAVRAAVTPEHGEFRLLTPLGAVEVRGTEFETTVEYPNGLPGDLSMNGSAKKVVVTVAVLSGAVWCQLGDSPVLLESGASQAFAGEADDNRTKGEVVAVTDFSVTVKSENQSVTFQVPKSNKLAVHEVGQLLRGDRVTVSWIEEEGRKWVRDIDGEGVIEGEVAALGDAWIEVRSENERKLRFRAPWRGGNPADGGGPDKEVVKKLGKVRVGDRVAVTWAMPEGKRVMNVVVGRRAKPAGNAPSQEGDRTKAPRELYGFSGRVIGRLVEKDVEKGALTLEILTVDRVWRGNKAKEPKSAEGRTLKIEGVFGKFLDALLTLKKGDGVRIEVKHVRGDGLNFLGEGLEKVEIEPKAESPREETQATKDGRAGMRGFRGILIGELVEKDVEKGTLVFKMEKVKRVWRASKAPAPEKSVGKPLKVSGVAGRFLDTLLTLEIGDRIEVEAFHVRGETLKFPGEWLKKAE